MRRAVIFNYNSIFAVDIAKCIRKYNVLRPQNMFRIEMFKSEEFRCESLAGGADFIMHSGGDGMPVIEDLPDIAKIYICHSHQWKAKKGGGDVIRLSDNIVGLRCIDILEDDDIFGRKGKMPIMEYHKFAVVSPPPSAKVIATAKAHDLNGREIEIIEALKYPDGSISVQGHPEEGTAAHIFYNFFKKLEEIKTKSLVSA